MQRLEGAGLFGTMASAPRVTARPQPRATARPEPRAARVAVAPSTPQPRNLRAPQESRPAGAPLGQVVAAAPADQVRGLQPGSLLQRLRDQDPLLLAAVRRHPAGARRLLATLNRVREAL